MSHSNTTFNECMKAVSNMRKNKIEPTYHVFLVNRAGGFKQDCRTTKQVFDTICLKNWKRQRQMEQRRHFDIEVDVKEAADD